MPSAFRLSCAVISGFLMACGSSSTAGFGSLTSAVQTRRGVTVCQVDGVDLQADVARPAAANHQRRAVMLVHGGGWSTGSRSDFESLLQGLAGAGVTAITVDYRLSPTVRHPQHLEDVKCALRWVRLHAAELDVDPNKLGIVGASAGAHLAAMLAYTPDDPRFEGHGAPSGASTRVVAAVLHGGPHDLTRYASLTADQQGTVNALLGTSSPTADQLREASPVEYVKAGAVPTLILHGEQDTVVPPAQAQALASRLDAVGTKNRVVMIAGAGHSDFGADPDTVGRELLEFLKQTLP